MADPLLQAEGVTKRYGGLVANDAVAMTLLAGEIRGLIGPNGAGKTTFVNLLTGFETLDGYARLLEDQGCTVLECQDLTAQWAEILVGRLAMYRSLRETTVARFGAEHFRTWDETYAFFVDLFARRQLAGGRLVARRDA